MRRLAAVVLLLGAACSASTPGSGPPSVDLSEFAIDATGGLTVGHNTLTITNSGEFSHTLVVAAESGEVIGATDVIAPGSEVDFDIDLTAGTYELSCRIVIERDSGELLDHYEAGMVARVEVAS